MPWWSGDIETDLFEFIVLLNSWCRLLRLVLHIYVTSAELAWQLATLTKNYLSVKLPIFYFISIFWFQICGCAFLGAGIWLRLAYQGYATLMPYHAALSADSLFITVGVLSFVITFFGCCGSWFQSRCLLITVSVGQTKSRQIGAI